MSPAELRKLAETVARPGCSMEAARAAAEVLRKLAEMLEDAEEKPG